MTHIKQLFLQSLLPPQKGVQYAPEPTLNKFTLFVS